MYKERELNQYSKDNHLNLVGLVETKIKENKAGVVNVVIPSWCFIDNYASVVNGRIWVGCDAAMYEVKVIQQSS